MSYESDCEDVKFLAEDVPVKLRRAENRRQLIDVIGQSVAVTSNIRELLHHFPPDGTTEFTHDFVEVGPDIALQDLQVRFDDQIMQVSELAELLERATDHISTGQGDPFTLGVDVAEYKRRYDG